MILQPGDYTVPPPTVINTTILPALQIAPFELLWGVGRSRPVNNPLIHGIASWTPGEPTGLDYRPAKIAADRDNLYCLRRLGQYLPDFSSATRFTESQTFQVSDPSAPEAIETDWHMQIGEKVWNPGLQLIKWSINTGIGNPAPARSTWLVRAFDYIKKFWVTQSAFFDESLLVSGLTLDAEYAIAPDSLTHVSVTINGQKFPLGFKQPVAIAKPVQGQVFNKAVQVDANGIAAPYVLKIGKMLVTFS